MKKTLITAPAVLPVSVEEVKDHLRISNSDLNFNQQIKGLITSAVERVESDTGRALISQTWDLVFDSWPDLIWQDIHAKIKRVMPLGVCQSVVSITYLDENEDSQTVSSDQYEISGLGTDACRIVFHSDGDFEYPDLYEVDPVTVRILCGYGSAGSVPEMIRTAIKIIVSDLFDDEDHDRTVAALLKPYRLWSF